MLKTLLAMLTANPFKTAATLPQKVEPDLYQAINTILDLRKHGVTKPYFMQNPEHNYYWCRIYQTNERLFADRINLVFFLENHPAEILTAALQNWTTQILPKDPTPAKPAVKKPTRKLLRLPDDTFDRHKPFANIVWRKGAFIEPFRNLYPVSKRRTAVHK